MTISVRLSEVDTLLIKKYAEINKLTMSEFIRNTVLEKIEDELDIKAYKKAIAEFKKNPISYSLDEVKKELDLQ